MTEESSWDVLLDACEELGDDVRPRFTAWVGQEMLPELFDAGVSLLATSDIAIDGCGGYFTDEDGPLLAIATGTHSWAATLVHEFCHFDQWRDHDPIWTSGILPDGTHGSEILDLWYGYNVELTEEQLTRYFEPILQLELNCERRTVQLIQDYDLPFETDRYTQEANAYLFAHAEFRRRRQWMIPGRAPYRVPEIIAEMPRDFVTATYTTTEPLPAHLQALYDPCFKEGAPFL